jgi:predicted CXXCH cytochrome family protein
VNGLISTLRLLLLAACLGWLLPAGAAEVESSGFGEIAIPQPAKPAAASACVEPVEIMRREHMNFLMHQRDDTVLDGERGSKYSLVGCMDCHNPSDSAETAVRYPDPQHFCADCHRYASVRIDCFECHADRGLGKSQQSQLQPLLDYDLTSLHSFRAQLEHKRVD